MNFGRHQKKADNTHSSLRKEHIILVYRNSGYTEANTDGSTVCLAKESTLNTSQSLEDKLLNVRFDAINEASTKYTQMQDRCLEPQNTKQEGKTRL